MKLLTVLFVTMLFLAGCSLGGVAVQEPRLYLLRADVQLSDGPQPFPVEVGIGRVSVATYLKQAGIVVATNNNRVRPSGQHLWAEPLETSIRLFLRDAIAAEKGSPISADTARRQSWDYRLDVRIDEWHGSLAGEARLIASWIVLDVANDAEIVSHRFERTATLQDDGYDALVDAQKSLLSELATSMAISLDEIK